jgi:hypothetical protein
MHQQMVAAPHDSENPEPVSGGAACSDSARGWIVLQRHRDGPTRRELRAGRRFPVAGYHLGKTTSGHVYDYIGRYYKILTVELKLIEKD